MKSLREKKLLARLARNSGQPDLALEESILREEEYNQKLFMEPKLPVVEDIPPMPPVNPPSNLIEKAVESINKSSNIPSLEKPTLVKKLQLSELDGIRAQIKELANKMSTMGTLSWGGGGTGVVRFADLDDKLSILNRIDFKNYAAVTGNSYTVTKNDYYIGVNHAGNVAIILPTPPEIPNGYVCVVKDESGNASGPTTWIDIYGSGGDLVDGVEYVRLQIDHGSLTFFYRDGWRII